MCLVSKLVYLTSLLALYIFVPCDATLPKVEWTEDQNIALYNLSCHPTTGHNVPCICPPGKVYLAYTQSCWEVPTQEHHACAHDVQCQAARWGHYSRCNKRTARCECYADPLRHGRRLAYWSREQNKCLFRNPVDLCRSDWDCKKLIGEGSHCVFDQTPAGVPGYDPNLQFSSGSGPVHGSCQCRRETHIWYERLQYCLPFARKPGDSCQAIEQCTQGSMGTLSKCGGLTGTKCECYPTGRTVYYAKTGQCFMQRQLGEECESGDECRASLGEAVECDGREEIGSGSRNSSGVHICRVKRVGDGCKENDDCSSDRYQRPYFCNKNVVVGGQHDIYNGEVVNFLYRGRCEEFRDDWDGYFGRASGLDDRWYLTGMVALVGIINVVSLSWNIKY